MLTASQPRAGGLTAAAARAAGWIESLRCLDPEAWRARPRAVCAALCAASTADRLAPGDVAWAAELLDDRGERALDELLAAPLAQTVTAAVICRRFRADVAVLDRLLDSALGLFAAEPAPDAGTTEARLIAHAAGLAAPPRLPAGPAAIRLPVADADVPALAVGVSAATGFGTRAAADDDVAELVSGLAAHRLRAYDLPLGAALLRALAHAGAAESVGGRRCAEFLRLQQSADGGFGYFGPEEVELASELPGFDPRLDLRLPVTLACAIALAEADDPAWRFALRQPR